MDQKLKFDGTIGYGISYSDSVFRYSKVFRLHAILHDAAGAVPLQTRLHCVERKAKVYGEWAMQHL